ncbi:hypothetical protein [Polaromonas sp.]|uniref:hypothetical protein n=1 Tax=Polaromonas sp. TaxID=1869339 RepID=UPI00352B8739
MKKLIQSLIASSVVASQRRENAQFCRDLQRHISVPWKVFTIGNRSIRPSEISIDVPAEMFPIPEPGHPGVAHVFIPCTVTPGAGETLIPDAKQYWLKVKLVDNMIAVVHLAETKAPAATDIADDLPETEAPR